MLAERGDELAALIATELGMPLTLSKMIQAGLPTMSFGSMAEQIEKIAWEEEVGNSLIVREPIGVVGAITPWNFPFMLNLSKITPALAAGNSVVLKPAPDTPWSATFIGRLAAEQTDIPPGVLNVVTSGDAADERRAPRRVGRGLEDDGVARRERGRDLRQVQHEREVPRRDRADHAERLAQGVGECIFLYRDGVTCDFAA
ncbi:MAG TPA: aldehyde dehydrogenase family protein, partial [Actinomycetota bacterium]|nr:aldehyde dehydrogenase family protein [Actinomycetota bacterium]